MTIRMINRMRNKRAHDLSGEVSGGPYVSET